MNTFSINHKTLSLLLITLFFQISCLAQTFNYVSNDDNSLNPDLWTDAGTWTITNPLNWSPDTPGNPTHGNFGTADIYGYTRSAGNLTIADAAPIVNIYDTLFIEGNFNVASNTKVNVYGLLVVKGNLTLPSGGVQFLNGGTVVTTGNVQVVDGYIDNSSDFYVFGTTTVGDGMGGGGGHINGCHHWETSCNPGSTMSSESDLQNNDPDLYTFVSSGNVELPIKLLFFEGAISSNSVLLDWATSEEENFDYFSIERSTDGFDFESIGKVFSSGKNTKVRQDYQFKDQAPISGTSYYRLKAVDFDGTFEYFKAIYIDYSGNISNNFASVYPNPGNGDQLILKFDNTLNTPVTLKVYDLSGAVIFEESTSQTSLNINFNNKVRSGLYLLSLEAGNKSETIKWLVR